MQPTQHHRSINTCKLKNKQRNKHKHTMASRHKKLPPKIEKLLTLKRKKVPKTLTTILHNVLQSCKEQETDKGKNNLKYNHFILTFRSKTVLCFFYELVWDNTLILKSRQGCCLNHGLTCDLTKLDLVPVSSYGLKIYCVSLAFIQYIWGPGLGSCKLLQHAMQTKSCPVKVPIFE